MFEKFSFFFHSSPVESFIYFFVFNFSVFPKLKMFLFLSLPENPPSRLFLLRPAATMILWQTSLSHSSKKLLYISPILQFLNSWLERVKWQICIFLKLDTSLSSYTLFSLLCSKLYNSYKEFFGIKMVGGELGKTWVEKFGVWLLSCLVS